MKTVIDILNNVGFFEFAEHALLGLNPFSLYDVMETVPVVKDEDGNDEQLDFENFEVLSITTDKMTVCAGGDWQEPLTFSLTPNGDKFIVTDIMTGFNLGLEIDKLDMMIF